MLIGPEGLIEMEAVSVQSSSCDVNRPGGLSVMIQPDKDCLERRV